MSCVREIGHATVITHGKDSEVFTITPGLFIPFSTEWDVFAPEFREGLTKYLANWFNPDGSQKRFTYYRRNPDNAEVWDHVEDIDELKEK